LIQEEIKVLYMTNIDGKHQSK